MTDDRRTRILTAIGQYQHKAVRMAQALGRENPPRRARKGDNQQTPNQEVNGK